MFAVVTISANRPDLNSPFGAEGLFCLTICYQLSSSLAMVAGMSVGSEHIAGSDCLREEKAE